jgi:hypothetical protein
VLTTPRCEVGWPEVCYPRAVTRPDAAHGSVRGSVGKREPASLSMPPPTELPTCRERSRDTCESTDECYWHTSLGCLEGPNSDYSYIHENRPPRPKQKPRRSADALSAETNSSAEVADTTSQPTRAELKALDREIPWREIVRQDASVKALDREIRRNSRQRRSQLEQVPGDPPTAW